jgi:vancomycin resistance protein YoaR
MPQHPPAHDETVRMRADVPDGRPSPHGNRRPAQDAADDTRPVTRDWLSGAPDAGPTTGSAPVAPSDDEWATQALDVDSEAEPDADLTATQAVLPPVTDEEGDRADSWAADEPPSGDEPPADGPRGPWWRRRAVLIPAGAVALLAAVYGADLAVSSGDIPRNTVVSGIDVGGLSPAAAAQALEKGLGPRVSADHTVVADDVTSTLSPATAGITLDVDKTVDAIDDQPLNPWTRLVSVFSDRAASPVIARDDVALQAQIETLAAQVDRAPVDASIALNGTTPSVTAPADGRAVDRDGAADAITAAFAAGGDPTTPIQLPVEVAHPHVVATEAQRVLDETVTPALSAPIEVVGAGGGPTAEVPVAAIAASLTFTPKDDGTLTVGMDPAALQTALGDGLKVFGSGAKDATFAVSGGAVSIVPSVNGTGVAPDHLVAQLLPVLTKPAPRSVAAELGPVPADLTTAEANALGIKEEIGSFTTYIANPNSGENIRVVAKKVDGALIMPGETFSLNEFTGPRGTAQGYVPAGVISGGKFTQAVGGGISQFATTMFNAVFFSGLEDVHHKPHSYYISRYPAGREATVYEGQIDLVWKNDSKTGVYVDTAWTPGSITVTFYGTKRYEIESVSGSRTNVRKPAVQEVPDTGTCKTQAGAEGFDITVTRVFKDLTTHAELKREDFHTHYAAEPIIRCIPPATPAPPTPGG